MFVYVTEFVFLFPNSTGCGHQLKVSSLLFHAVFSHFYHEIVHFVFYAFIHSLYSLPWICIHFSHKKYFRKWLKGIFPNNSFYLSIRWLFKESSHRGFQAGQDNCSKLLRVLWWMWQGYIPTFDMFIINISLVPGLSEWRDEFIRDV